MENQKEELRERAIKAFSEQVRQNVQKFTTVMDSQELDIDKIEALWGELRKQADGVIAELYGGLVNEIPEKPLIVKKKRK
jgi:dethiobiotin synthetase